MLAFDLSGTQASGLRLSAMMHMLLLLLSWGAASVFAKTCGYALEPQSVAAGAYVLAGSTKDFTLRNGGNVFNTGFVGGDARRSGHSGVGCAQSLREVVSLLRLAECCNTQQVLRARVFKLRKGQ